MTKKIKSTYDELVESLSPQEKKEFDEEYKDLLLSEMILAAMHEDDISVRKLAKLAGVSPTIVQGMRTRAKNFSIGSFFKVLKGLNCKIIIERNGHQLPLDVTRSIKK